MSETGWAWLAYYQSTVCVLHIRHVVNLNRKLDISGRGDDAELDYAIKLLAEVAAAVESDNSLSIRRL